MSAKLEFLANFERKQQMGLQDIKFCVKDGDSLQREDFMSASNGLDRAISDGRCVRSNSWKRDPSLAAQEALS